MSSRNPSVSTSLVLRLQTGICHHAQSYTTVPSHTSPCSAMPDKFYCDGFEVPGNYVGEPLKGRQNELQHFLDLGRILSLLCGKSLDLLEFWLSHFQAGDSGTNSTVAANTERSKNKQRSALYPLNLQSLCSCVQKNSPFPPETSTLVTMDGKGSLGTWSLGEVILKTWTGKPLPYLPVNCLKFCL